MLAKGATSVAAIRPSKAFPGTQLRACVAASRYINTQPFNHYDRDQRFIRARTGNTGDSPVRRPTSRRRVRASQHRSIAEQQTHLRLRQVAPRYSCADARNRAVTDEIL